MGWKWWKEMHAGCCSLLFIGFMRKVWIWMQWTDLDQVWLCEYLHSVTDWKIDLNAKFQSGPLYELGDPQ